MIDDVAPFILGALVFMIPIVAILTNHQRKMAELLHGQNRGQQPMTQATDPMLLNELARMRELIAQQSIAIDTLAKSQKDLEQRLTQSEGLQQRLNQ